MNNKSSRNVEQRFVVSLIVTLILFFMSPSASLAQTEALSKSLYLTIRLQSAYNPGFKMCMPIAINDPLEISWARDLVKSSISVSVFKSEGGMYHASFELKEGMLDYVREIRLEPELKLDKPFEKVTQFTGGFEISHRQSLLLSGEACK